MDMELWRLKSCEIFYGFLMFSFHITAAGCQFQMQIQCVESLSTEHWWQQMPLKRRQNDSEIKEYDLRGHFGPSTVILNKTQPMAEW